MTKFDGGRIIQGIADIKRIEEWTKKTNEAR